MPFPGGIEDTSNGTLLFAVLLAIAYGWLVARPPSWRRTAVKTGSVALLALLAALQGGPLLLILALVLSAAGDAFLSREGEKAFLAGLVSFLAAHFAYIALFALVGDGFERLLASPWRLAIAAAMTVAVALLMGRLWPAVGKALQLPVTVYALAILAMGMASLTTLLPLAILGAALFMASDSLLAIGRFLMRTDSTHQGWVQPAVWALYFAAQLSIVLAFLA